MSTFMGITDNYRKALAEEYQRLSYLLILNPLQEERIAYILELALQDPRLDSLIQKIDLEALSDDDLHSILDQQAKMREYLGIEGEASSFPYLNTRVAEFT